MYRSLLQQSLLSINPVPICNGGGRFSVKSFSGTVIAVSRVIGAQNGNQLKVLRTVIDAQGDAIRPI